MPTYDYLCPEGHSFEVIQKMTGKPRAKCPRCGRLATRVISGGAGLIFKGSGFYITDYGKDGKGARKAEGETTAAPAGGTAKAETQGEAKAETKTQGKPEKTRSEKGSK